MELQHIPHEQPQIFNKNRGVMVVTIKNTLCEDKSHADSATVDVQAHYNNSSGSLYIEKTGWWIFSLNYQPYLGWVFGF